MEGVYTHQSADYYIKAACEGKEEARVWLQIKSHELDKQKSDKSSFIDPHDLFLKTKIHFALGNYHQAWEDCQSLVKMGYLDAPLYFYGKKIGERSVEEVNAFFDELLDHQLSAVLKKDQQAIKWILVMFNDQVKLQLPLSYENKRDNSLLALVQAMSFKEAWDLGQDSQSNLSAVRSVIGKKIKTRLEIPQSIQFYFISSYHHSDRFIIRLHERNEETYKDNLRKLPLFCESVQVGFSTFNTCLAITENSFDQFKQFLNCS